MTYLNRTGWKDLTLASGSDRMDFGMHSNKSYAEVLEDSGYTKWCIQTSQEGECGWKLKRYAQWAIRQQPTLPAKQVTKIEVVNEQLQEQFLAAQKTKALLQKFTEAVMKIKITGNETMDVLKAKCIQGLKDLTLASGSDRMDFGMHSNKTYAEVLEDSGYTKWCIQTSQEGECGWKLKRYAQWAIRQQPTLPAKQVTKIEVVNEQLQEQFLAAQKTKALLQKFTEAVMKIKITGNETMDVLKAKCIQGLKDLTLASGSDRMDFGMHSNKTYAEVLEDSGYTKWCIQTSQEGECGWKLKRYAQWAIRQQPAVEVLMTTPPATSPKSRSWSLGSYSMVSLRSEDDEVEDEVIKRIDEMAEELRLLKLKTITAAQRRVK